MSRLVIKNVILAVSPRRTVVPSCTHLWMRSYPLQGHEHRKKKV